MNRFVQYGVIFLVSVFLGVSAGVWVVVNLGPDSLKPVIYRWVKKNTQRTLTIDGDVYIAFYPILDIRLRDLTLSEYQRDDKFATIEHVHISISMWPLLRKQLIAGHVTIEGLHAGLVRYQDGRLNIDDFLIEDEKSLTFDWNIAQIKTIGSCLMFRDEMTEQVFVFNDLSVTAERLTSESIRKIRMQSRWSSAAVETADSVGSRGGFEMQWVADNVSFKEKEFISGTISGVIQRIEPDDHLTAVIAFSDLQKSHDRNIHGSMHFELDSKQDKQSVQAFLDTALTIRWDDRQLSMSDFKTEVDFFHPEFTRKPVHGRFGGNLHLDVMSGSLQTVLKGVLAGSAIHAVVQVQDFTERRYAFNVQLDQLNLNSFFPVQASEIEKKVGLSENKAKQPDFSFLNDLELNGSIHIGQLQLGNIQSSGIQLTFQPGQQYFDINKPIQ